MGASIEIKKDREAININRNRNREYIYIYIYIIYLCTIYNIVHLYFI